MVINVGKLSENNEVAIGNGEAEDILPQQVTYYELPVRRVRWERVTMAVLAFGALAFWVWGKNLSSNLERAANERALEQLQPPAGFSLDHPETVSFAVLPLAQYPATSSRPSLSFVEPAPDATVGATLTVQGMVRGVSEGKHLWLITRRDAQTGFWPKERIRPDAEGRFEQTTWDYGPDGRMSICVLATTPEDTLRFDEWLSVGDRDDIWPSLEPIASRSTVLGCQDVKLDKHLSH